MISVDRFADVMSTQSLTVIFGSCILIVISCIVFIALRLPYGSLISLVTFSVILMIIQSISVNCMIHGGCVFIAWIFSILTLVKLMMT